jgi:formylglycine-generating enzyme
MISIPAGIFQRDYVEANISEITQRYSVSQYEITGAQFAAVTGAPDPSEFSSAANHPAESVNWYDAVEFCNKLSAKENLESVYAITGRNPDVGYPIQSAAVIADFTKNGYRLPTEMEWMWAAMGASPDGQNSYIDTTGFKQRFTRDSGFNAIDEFAWYSGNSNGNTHNVGSKAFNVRGLYDMNGNVYEWCWDLEVTNPTGTLTDFRGATSGTDRVLRGGGWNFEATYCYMYARNSCPQLGRSSGIGFRVVRND